MDKEKSPKKGHQRVVLEFRHDDRSKTLYCLSSEKGAVEISISNDKDGNLIIKPVNSTKLTIKQDAGKGGLTHEYPGKLKIVDASIDKDV